MELQFSQYQHQSTPVPSTDKVCSAVRYRNIDPLVRRHEYTRGFPHEASATDTWCMLVGSCLQCRGASAIWFVNHWWHLGSLTRISVWPCCTPGPWNTSRSCVWWWISTKAESQWSAGEDSLRNVWRNKIQADANALLLSMLWRSEIAMGHRAARSLNEPFRLRDDDDGDDDEGWKTCVKNGG